MFEQQEIEGHAVRATLMCAGVAAIARATSRPEYCRTAQRLWDNLVRRKLYITGGSGATAEGEAFAQDYVLPNTGYLETCAAIGSAFFSRNMNLAFAEARYVDELERELYNAVLAGVSLAGNTYTYVNPLEFERGAQARWAWHGCPCCPPMLAESAWLPCPVLRVRHGRAGRVCELVCRQPRQSGPGRPADLAAADNQVSLGGNGADRCRACRGRRVRSARADSRLVPGRAPTRTTCTRTRAADRRPARSSRCRSTAEPLHATCRSPAAMPTLRRTWQSGDMVDVTMDMPVRRMKSHPQVAGQRRARCPDARPARVRRGNDRRRFPCRRCVLAA